ncbi:PIN domain-containing protein [Streptomyces nodosus]
MIILDTSILRSFGLQSSSADLLRTIEAVGGERIGVPWMAMEELAAQQAIKYQELHKRAAQARDALREGRPWIRQWRAIDDIGRCNPEAARAYWRSQWESLVTVIPTSDKSTREALFREANCLPPCRESKGQKIGSRDAAIWLSAVEYANDHPNETVYFVSANTKDFGDGSSFPYPMNEDVAHLGDRFIVLTSVDNIASRFTEPAAADETLVTDILRSDAVLPSVHAATDEHLPYIRSRRFDCTVQSLSGRTFIEQSSTWTTLSIRFASVREIQAFCIGGHEWCTAAVDWHLIGATHGRYEPVVGVVSWPTVVLFTLNREAPKPTVLRDATPRPVSEQVVVDLSIPAYNLTDIEETLASAHAKAMAAGSNQGGARL